MGINVTKMWFEAQTTQSNNPATQNVGIVTFGIIGTDAIL